MKTLEQFNSEMREYYYNQKYPHLNGIACPTCGAEMWDSDPMSTLTSNPPQKMIHREECGYSGYRVA